MNIEEVREYCLSKPWATEDMPFGDDYVTFRVAGKIFCGIALSQGLVVQMKCSPDEFDEVTAQYPFVHQAWHWHKRHWVQVDLSEPIPEDVVCKLIDRAYEVVFNKLPKKLRKTLGISGIFSERITRDSAIFEKVIRLYETAFPADERAPLDMLVDGREWNGDFRAYFIKEEAPVSSVSAAEPKTSVSGSSMPEPAFVGLAFNYVDDRFCYLFYLAVEPQMRKRGIGSAILRNIAESYPNRSLILEMEELDPAAENYEERLQRSHFYQSNGLKLTAVHNTQCGVPYHVLCTDPTITLADYSRMWHNIVRIQGYTEDDGRKWLKYIFGDSIFID